MTSIDTDKERLIRLEEQLNSASKELRALEKDLNEAELENKTLRYEARQYASVKDQYGKGLISHLIDIVKLSFAVIAALIAAKYGVSK